MKKLLTILAVAALTWFGATNTEVVEKPVISASAYVAQASPAFGDEDDGTQVSGQGDVARILSDDLTGSRHQRFIIRQASGKTLLVVHNIDVAPRIDELGVGDKVLFHGEYVWNEQGGLVHWTHRNPDPDGHHPHGWLEHNGVRYE